MIRVPNIPLLVFGYFFIEILAFWGVSQWLGFLRAIGLLCLLFFLGMFLFLFQIRSLTAKALKNPSKPGAITADAALVILAALWVAIPGYVTTVSGILLLIPPIRTMVRRSVGIAVRRKLEKMGAGAFYRMSAMKSTPSSDTPPGWGVVIDHEDGSTHTALDRRDYGSDKEV